MTKLVEALNKMQRSFHQTIECDIFPMSLICPVVSMPLWQSQAKVVTYGLYSDANVLFASSSYYVGVGS